MSSRPNVIVSFVSRKYFPRGRPAITTSAGGEALASSKTPAKVLPSMALVFVGSTESGSVAAGIINGNN
ncbi:MAG: hypothetical protein NT000_06590 [Proteobacteria bacterium]|nr:hypothetical protein [Pseudomonadota bacterium]